LLPNAVIPTGLMAFTITGAKIVAIDLIDDPARIAEAELQRWKG
jgi:hypothetical protein